jgi:hypothetical protein
MTLFQLIQVRPPIRLTHEGEKRWELIKSHAVNDPNKLYALLKEGLEGITDALHFSREGSPFFDEMIDHDLN